MGVCYKTQVLLCKKFCVDVLVKKHKLVIQWDGDYWHGYRKRGDATVLDKRQSRRVKLDKSQDAYLRKCGYTVLRVWEHDVKNNKTKVYANINKAIQRSAA